MFDVLAMLQTYMTPVVAGICLCVGYILKHSFASIPNKYIPIIMGILGIVLAVWVLHGFTAEIILTGLVSGLGSTGFHQAFQQAIENKE